MPTSHIRRTAAAAALAAGSLALFVAPAGAQDVPCYPPTPGCVPVTAPGTAPPLVVAEDVDGDGTAAVSDGDGSLAKTGAVVVPAALVGLGLVAGGVVLKRSSRRGKRATPAG